MGKKIKHYSGEYHDLTWQRALNFTPGMFKATDLDEMEFETLCGKTVKRDRLTMNAGTVDCDKCNEKIEMAKNIMIGAIESITPDSQM